MNLPSGSGEVILCSDSTIGCSSIFAVHMRLARKTSKAQETAHSCWTSQKVILYGEISRNVHIELPPKILSRTAVGRLWHAELELKLRALASTPCLYYHPSLGIRVVGHVDDLTFIGPRSGLDTFLAKLLSVGPGLGEEQEKSLLDEVFAGAVTV